jgi:hypothetical protein
VTSKVTKILYYLRRIENLYPSYVKESYHALRADNFVSGFYRSLTELTESYSILSSKKKEKVQTLLSKKVFPKKTLRKLFSKESLPLLRRIPRNMLVHLDQGIPGQKEIARWFYKSHRPSTGWPKRRKPFPSSRAEMAIFTRLGNFPRSMKSICWGTHIVSPRRISMSYLNFQFWTWLEWQQVKLILTPMLYSQSRFAKSIVNKLSHRLPKALDDLEKNSRSHWFSTVTADLFIMRRVSLRVRI